MRVLSGLALALLWSACLTPSLSPCGDLLCAPDAICVEDVVCASPEQVAACAGVEPDGACSTTQTTGRCVLGVCVGNVCGDGLVTGNEVCDGTEITLGCEAFGFYGGEVSCKPACTADTSQCIGRCGDAIVHAEFDEQCDTLPPVEGCLDYGHDWGVLTCNAFCAPAISRDCQRYGWDVLLPTSVAYRRADANAHGAIGLNAAQVDVVWDGVTTTRANPGWALVTSSANAFVAVGNASIGWFDGTWHDLPFGVVTNAISLGDDGYLFAFPSGGCAPSEINLAAATVTVLPVSGTQPCTQGVAFARTELYVAQGSEGVRKWDGVQWSNAIPGSTFTLERAGSHRFVLGGGGKAQVADVATGVPEIGPLVFLGVDTTIAVDEDQNVLFRTGDSVQATPTFNLRAHSMFVALGLAHDGQTVSADGRIVTFGTGVRAMRALNLASVLPPPLDATISFVHHASDGLIACGSTVFVSGIAGFVQRPYDAATAGRCLEVTGAALGAHYVVTDTGALLGYNAGNNTYAPVVDSGVRSAAGDFTQLWTSVGNQLIGITNGVTGNAVTETLPAGCVASQVAMSPNRRFVGVGTCSGQLAVFERATTWSLLATLASSGVDAQISIGDDDTIFVRNVDKIYRLDGTTFTLIGQGKRVVAVAADDVFIDQGGETMLHITPTVTQEIRLASGPFVASPTHLFSWDSVTRRVQGIARMTNVPNGP